MILKKLSLINFMGWAKLDIPLGQHTGVTAILGMIDGDSGRSNGTGKTSLMTSLVFALYGKQIAKNMDELIMQGKEEEGFKVTLVFEHGGVEYELTRKKKAGGQQKVQLKDLTHDKVLPSTEPEAIIGMPLAVWNNTIYSAQGNLAGLVAQSPSVRKDMLTEIFGMGNYLILEETARTLRNGVDNKLIQEQAGVDLLKSQVARIQVDPAELAACDKHIADLDAEILTFQARIDELKSEVAVGEATLARAADLDAQVADLDSEYRRVSGRELSAIESYAKKKAALQSEISAGKAKLSRIIPANTEELKLAKEVAMQATADILKEQQELDEISAKRGLLESELRIARYKLTEASNAAAEFSKLGSSCPTCGSVITEQHAAEHLQQLSTLKNGLDKEAALLDTELYNICITEHKSKDKIAELRQVASGLSAIEANIHRAASLVMEAEYATKAIADAESQYTTLEAQHMQDIVDIAETKSAISAKHTKLATERASFSAIESKNKLLASKLTQATRELAGTAGVRECYLTSKQQLLSSINEKARLSSEAERAAARAAVLTSEKEVYAELIKAFGPSGIPTMILETCLADLQGYLDDYMELLSDGRIKVTFKTTKTTLSTSKVSETLAIVVSDINGERDIAFYSGGERVRICLAIRLALARLIANRSGTKPGLLLIDEVADLDESGLTSFIQLLRSVDTEFNQIFLVSHLPELKNACPGSLVLHRDIYGNYIRS